MTDKSNNSCLIMHKGVRKYGVLLNNLNEEINTDSHLEFIPHDRVNQYRRGNGNVEVEIIPVYETSLIDLVLK